MSKKEVDLPVSIIRTLAASSPKSWDDAVDQGLKRALKTVRGITEIKVIHETARVEDGKIKEFCVKLKLRFVLEDA